MKLTSATQAKLTGMVVFGTFFVTAASSAQPNTTIQLPSFSNFSINTVVSVPDGGTMSMGGVNRFSSQGIRRGIPGLPSNPFTNSRAFGQSVGANNASVSAKILILGELEAQHMQGYVPVPAIVSKTVTTEPPPAIRRKAAFISNNLGGKKKR